jgi:LPS-assembly lipoprotein
MLLYNRRKFIFLSLATTGCSFSPVYKSDLGPKFLRGKIVIPKPNNRDEYMLFSKLEENFGQLENPLFKLSVSVSVSVKGVGGLGSITRYSLIGDASFRLIKISTGKIIISDNIKTFTSHSASSQTLATETAARVARDRLMGAIANQVSTSIIMNYNTSQ